MMTFQIFATTSAAMSPRLPCSSSPCPRMSDVAVRQKRFALLPDFSVEKYFTAATFVFG
jgi:hypothetical protein